MIASNIDVNRSGMSDLAFRTAHHLATFPVCSYDDDDSDRIYNNLDNSFDDDYEEVYGTLVECAAVKVSQSVVVIELTVHPSL